VVTALVAGSAFGVVSTGGADGSGKRSANSFQISSASMPIAFAYDRTNARRKIPDGHRRTSSRSSAASSDSLILVFDAMDANEI